ncbi:hypothetical protein VCHENC03_4028 [Vibrio sp. HENC-03]|nr:hypothetical protein VCHENC03_4028 [Vibrio sp. HENC-03]
MGAALLRIFYCFTSWKGSEILLSTQADENLASYSASLYHSSVGMTAAP